MLKTLTAAVVALLAAFAHATPIVFTTAQFDTLAIAAAQGVADIQSASSPPDALPVLSEAVVIGSTDVATAGALGAEGFLTAAADVTSITDVASAVATVLFNGTFTGDGRLSLFVDFVVLSFATGTGSGAVTLLVTLIRDGTTLIDELLTSATSIGWGLELTPGATAELSLLLVSESQALGATGAAFNQGLVQFRVEQLPLLPTHAFVLLGVLVLAAVRGRPARTAR